MISWLLITELLSGASRIGVAPPPPPPPPPADEVGFSDTRTPFHHQERFLAIPPPWKSPAGEAKAFALAAREAERVRQNAQDAAQAERHLIAVLALIRAQDAASAEQARLWWQQAVAAEVERQDAEAAFLTLILALI